MVTSGDVAALAGVGGQRGTRHSYRETRRTEIANRLKFDNNIIIQCLIYIIIRCLISIFSLSHLSVISCVGLTFWTCSLCLIPFWE